MKVQETIFAQKVCRHLDDALEDLPNDINDRLLSARRLALSQQKQTAPFWVYVLKTVTVGPQTQASSWIDKVGMAVVSVLLVGFLFGFFHYEEQRHIQKLASLDVAVLMDELPPKAYTDSGFCAYLEKQNGV